jgi:hypothetical protein
LARAKPSVAITQVRRERRAPFPKFGIFYELRKQGSADKSVQAPTRLREPDHPEISTASLQCEVTTLIYRSFIFVH